MTYFWLRVRPAYLRTGNLESLGGEEDINTVESLVCIGMFCASGRMARLSFFFLVSFVLCMYSE